jgi:arylsulfatase A-like enzyme
MLAEHGFETASIVNSFYLHHRFGLDRGFASATLLDHPVGSPQPSKVTDHALGWLAERTHGDKPFFLFLHYYDTHSDYASLPRYRRRFEHPYAGPADGTTAQLNAVRKGKLALGPRDAAHLRDLYAAGIRQLDDSLGRLLGFLEESGLADDTLVVLTSDHGEEFLDHGGVMHGATHFEEVMRVPLLMAGPGLPRGVRVAEPVSLVDVVPTALALLGVPVTGRMDGLDLAPLWRGGDDAALRDRALFADTAVNTDWNDSLASVRRGSLKLVEGLSSGRRALFDLASDPAEERDVGAARAGDAARMAGELARYLGREAAPPEAPIELTPQEREKLRALGYLD